MARVNDETISADEFKARLSEYRMGSNPSLGPIPEELAVRKKILNELIEERVLLAEARRRKIDVPQERVDIAIRTVESDYPPNSFDEVLKEQRISRSRFKERMRVKLTVEALIDQATKTAKNPGPDGIKKYYIDHIDRYRKVELFHISQIVVKTEEDAEALAKEIKGGAAFEGLARAHSFTPEGSHGGDLGFVTRAALPGGIGSALDKLAIGKVSSPIQTEYGFHLIKVLDRRPEHLETLNEATPAILATLTQEEREQNFVAWRRDLLSKARIERNHALLASIH